MFGRVLFAFVWLIIAAGLVLPLYPGDGVTSVVAGASDLVQPVAGSVPVGCADCPVDDGGAATCASECPCSEVTPVTFVPLAQTLSVTITVYVRPRVPEQDAALPAKLPAI